MADTSEVAAVERLWIQSVPLEVQVAALALEPGVRVIERSHQPAEDGEQLPVSCRPRDPRARTASRLRPVDVVQVEERIVLAKRLGEHVKDSAERAARTAPASGRQPCVAHESNLRHRALDSETDPPCPVRATDEHAPGVNVEDRQRAAAVDEVERFPAGVAATLRDGHLPAAVASALEDLHRPSREADGQAVALRAKHLRRGPAGG